MAEGLQDVNIVRQYGGMDRNRLQSPISNIPNSPVLSPQANDSDYQDGAFSFGPKEHCAPGLLFHEHLL